MLCGNLLEDQRQTIAAFCFKLSKVWNFIKKQVVAPPTPTQLSLLDFSNIKTFSRVQTTSDSVLGGYSTAYVDPYRLDDGRLVAQFHGNLNQSLPASNPKVKQSGWAMFKTKNRNPKPNAQFKPFYWFKKQTNFWWDFTPFQVLHIRVANLNPNRKFMLNVQADTMSRTDLFQHRLMTSMFDDAKPLVGANQKIPWEDLFVNIDDLVLTNKGQVQIQYYGEFERDRVKSVGLSISDKIFGPFNLLIDRIECVGGVTYLEQMNQSRERVEYLAEADTQRLLSKTKDSKKLM